MFEEKEEDILKRMMDKVPNDLDKRVGSSLIYNALAPTAQEIARIRSDMDRFLKYGFADPNIPDEYLDYRAKEHGLTRKPADYAIKLGTFTDSEGNLMDIALNSRFSIDKINYKAIEKIETGKYKMQCESIGVTGNYPNGALLPMEYIEKLGSASISDIILEGVDIEINESFYNRFMIKVQTPATSGNKYDYLDWALKVQGVENAIIKPLWNGSGTVKILITATDNKTPTDELILKVTEYIQEQRPIGATITVVGVEETNVNIQATLILEAGYNLDDIKEKIIANINAYFKTITLKSIIVRFNRIVNCILDIPGVVDYTNITLNNVKENIDLGEDNIPILESVVVDIAT